MGASGVLLAMKTRGADVFLTPMQLRARMVTACMPLAKRASPEGVQCRLFSPAASTLPSRFRTSNQMPVAGLFG